MFYYEPKDLNVFDVFKFIYSFWCVNHPSFVQQEPILVGLEPFRCSLLASLLSRMTRYCWFIFYISWVCVLSCVQLFATPWTVAPPGYSVHGVFQARILEWVAVSSSRESSQPRDQTCISYISALAGGFFTTVPPTKPFLTLDQESTFFFFFARNSFIVVRDSILKQQARHWGCSWLLDWSLFLQFSGGET